MTPIKNIKRRKMPSKRLDRQFMLKALSEMQKSRGEHTDRADPLVGAVLVSKGGKILGETHRGGLRVGDHAEYALIERLLANRNLERSTLYVTLEPCIARVPPKKPCAERIISARIGRVIVGMLDPNPDISGRGITYLQNNNVEVDFFDLDLVQQIREENKDFISQYEHLEGTKILEAQCEGPSEAEKRCVSSATIEDLNPKLIKQYLHARGKAFKILSSEMLKFLAKNGFLGSDKRKKIPCIPTVSGVLLFGRNPEDFMVQSKIKAESNIGDKTVTSDIIGPLLSQPERVREFLENNMRIYTEIREFERVQVPEYPWEAIREAVVNAIVHRDYKEGARILIQISRENLIIKSPGLPLRPLSLAKIRSYNAPPFDRNPRIADTFNHMKLMEQRGWGFRKMRDILVSHGLSQPQFSYDGIYFVVTFFASEYERGHVRIAADLLASLDKKQKSIIDLMRASERITSIECAEQLKIDRSTAIRNLNKLINLGIVKKRGRGPSIYYILAKR
jgi:ATP-dependent DNA helicase RecG